MTAAKPGAIRFWWSTPRIRVWRWRESRFAERIGRIRTADSISSPINRWECTPSPASSAARRPTDGADSGNSSARIPAPTARNGRRRDAFPTDMRSTSPLCSPTATGFCRLRAASTEGSLSSRRGFSARFGRKSGAHGGWGRRIKAGPGRCAAACASPTASGSSICAIR